MALLATSSHVPAAIRLPAAMSVHVELDFGATIACCGVGYLRLACTPVFEFLSLSFSGIVCKALALTSAQIEKLTRATYRSGANY